MKIYPSIKTHSPMKTYSRVLSIAGSDSGGGAGIQADLKTFSALGCYGCSAITAVTAQNTQSVVSVFPISPSLVQEQIEAVLSDIGADAIKIGMLFSTEIIEVVATTLQKYKTIPIVLDPVMMSKSGAILLQPKAISAIKELLLPMTSIFTPNLKEASLLLESQVRTKVDMEQAAQELANLGPAVVVVKGGHLQDERKTSPDYIYFKQNNQRVWISANRIETFNTHGTGCTFSAAIAAYLAQGKPFLPAIKKAKQYLSKALQTGAFYRIGDGHGPVHHFYSFWS